MRRIKAALGKAGEEWWQAEDGALLPPWGSGRPQWSLETLALRPHGPRLGLLPTEGPAEVHALGEGLFLPLTWPVAGKEWRLRPGPAALQGEVPGPRPPEACRGGLHFFCPMF